MLEAVAAAGGAAAGARVEAERAGGVAALLRLRQPREALADHVERADVARRVRARGAPIGVWSTITTSSIRPAPRSDFVPAGRIGRLALRLQQRRMQDVLHQRRLAGPDTPVTQTRSDRAGCRRRCRAGCARRRRAVQPPGARFLRQPRWPADTAPPRRAGVIAAGEGNGASASGGMVRPASQAPVSDAGLARSCAGVSKATIRHRARPRPDPCRGSGRPRA